MQAALGTAQLERLNELVARKREMFCWYGARLKDLPGVVLNAEPRHTKNSYWTVTAIFPAKWGGKEAIIQELSRRDIDSRPILSPLSALPAYREHEQAKSAVRRNSVSYQIGPDGVNLPSALCLSEADVDRVWVALREIQP